MFKKCVIFLFLSTAYTVLLAHNFTPHQHDTEQATPHHGHDHDDDDQDGGDKGNSFHLFPHMDESGIVYNSVQIIHYQVQKKDVTTSFIKWTDIFLRPFEKPPSLGPPERREHLSFPQTLPYFFPLKAPPAFTA